LRGFSSRSLRHGGSALHFLCAGALIGLAGTSGCRAGGDDRMQTAEPGSPEAGGTAVIAVAGGATTLLPPLATTALDYDLAGELYLGLNHGRWVDGSLRYQPGDPLGLAREWRFSEDRTTLTYKLRTGVRWSDGVPITAADVAFTFDLLADTALALPLSSVTAEIASVEGLDSATVRFHFRRAYPGVLFDTGVGIIPAHVFGHVARAELAHDPRLRRPEGGALVVSGPFAVESWKPDDRVVLVRNEASPLQPLLDRVVFRVMPDEASRVAEFRGGRIDAAQMSSFRLARRLRKQPGVRLTRIQRRAYDFIAWNPASHPALAQPEVRRALSLAIDRDEIIRALDMEGFAEPALGPYGSLFPGLEPSPDGQESFDPAEARRLLDAAGWRASGEDGIRRRRGQRLEFELLVPAANERRGDAAQIIQRELLRVGVNLSLRKMEFRSLFGRVLARDYQAAMLGWQVALDPDITAFWSAPDDPLNLVGYDDPITRALLASARTAPSRELADPRWRRAAERISAADPYAFLWYFDQLLAVGPRLRGPRSGVLGFTADLYRWWIPAARRRTAN